MLNAKLLEAEMQAALKQAGFKQSDENQKFIKVISEAIIKHIITNAVVLTTCTALSQTGKVL